MDFANPDDVKEMLAEEFGKDNMACLSSFHTFNAKGLLKDLGRVHDIDIGIMEGLTKKIDSEMFSLKGPEGMPAEITLDMAINASQTLKGFLSENKEINRFFKSLYGKNRHVGRHAAGVVIGDNLPRETSIFTSKGIVQTSFTEGIANKDLSAMGLVKFDLLGLKTLSVIDHAIKLISISTGKEYKDIYESLRPCNLNLNDMKVLKHVFWDGNYCGVFQYSERGIQQLAMQLKPTCFEDIATLGALYRPGPLSSGMDKLYVQGKHYPETVVYDHPILENILNKTYGTLVYQEQVMAISNKLGKLTLGEAEKLRKLISKKQKGDGLKELEDMKIKFVSGCIENDYEENKANNLWDMMARFAGYGFNLCVINSQLVTIYDKDGNFLYNKKIKDVLSGEYVRSKDEDIDKDIFIPVKKNHSNGEQELFEFEFDNGEKVSCTMNHKFRTKCGKMFPIKTIMEMNLEVVFGVEEKTKDI